LGADATHLLTVFSLWKIRKFLDSTMRLRTACELEIDEAKGVSLKQPGGQTLPDAGDLTKSVGDLIQKCKSLFADPTVTELTWNNPKI
jgi:CRISPR-associated protein Csb1